MVKADPTQGKSPGQRRGQCLGYEHTTGRKSYVWCNGKSVLPAPPRGRLSHNTLRGLEEGGNVPQVGEGGQVCAHHEEEVPRPQELVVVDVVERQPVGAPGHHRRVRQALAADPRGMGGERSGQGTPESPGGGGGQKSPETNFGVQNVFEANKT